MAGIDTIQTAYDMYMKVMESLAFQPELCLRQTSPRSKCDFCAQVCPVEAITFGKPKNLGQLASMHLDQDACIECGLCTVVCPTSAFIWTKPTLLQMRNKVARSVAKKEGTTYITCSQTRVSGESSNILTVPCLGMLPAEFWLSILSDFADDIAVYLPSDLCSRCKIKTGEELLLQEISAGEIIADAPLNLVENYDDLDFVKAKDTAGYDMSKRNFFSDIQDLARRSATVAVDTVVEHESERPRTAIERFRDDRAKAQRAAGKEPLEGDEDREIIDVGASTVLTARRELLLETLKRHPEMAERTPVRLPHISDACTMCKACAFLCPTESLRIGENEIVLNPHTCAGCGLCSIICYPQAIELYERNANIYFHNGKLTLTNSQPLDEASDEPGDTAKDGDEEEVEETYAEKSDPNKKRAKGDHANSWRMHTLDDLFGSDEKAAERAKMESSAEEETDSSED